jgi:hypothetical protein
MEGGVEQTVVDSKGSQLVQLLRNAAEQNIGPTSLIKLVGIRPIANSFTETNPWVGNRRMALVTIGADGRSECLLTERLLQSRGFAYWHHPNGKDEVIGILWSSEGRPQVFTAKWYDF